MSLKPIRDLSRRIVDQLFLKRLPSLPVPEGGHAWRIGWSGDLPDSGRFLLYEDGQLLGPAESTRSMVSTLGRGHYGWRGRDLLFSTTDNSDPSTNGREYRYSDAPFLAKRRSSLPTNYSSHDASAEAIQREVDRIVVGVTRLLAATTPYLPGDRSDWAGAPVLEIGPGRNYGWLLGLACTGAIPAAVDAYPARWDSKYHLPLFERLRERLSQCEFVSTLELIDQVIEEASFECIPRSGSSLEQTTYPSNQYELVFSNAVIEHLYDPWTGIEQLFRVTKPGGIGCHWVDFRDHRDFDRPLEYLLMSDADFAREFGLRHGECGNRLRQDETADHLQRAGFEILDFEPTFEIEESYFDALLPRLRAAEDSSYRDISPERLRVLHGRFLVRKPTKRAMRESFLTSPPT